MQYPYLLSEINDRPKILYVLGNTELLRRNLISIVGSRDCSDYGKEACIKLAYNLASQGIVIVSGLALGIDSCAHIGTLKAKGKTVAVVAHGLDMIYPKENINLAKQIVLSGGAIVSEFPLGTRPLAENFPKRNRIISGLSKGTVVVEAKEHSGSLITAQMALEQGRRVFAFPGNIFSQYSKGTNKLIKEGAEIITNINDLNFI